MLFLKIELTVSFETTDSKCWFQTDYRSALGCALFHTHRITLSLTHDPAPPRARLWARSWNCSIEQESPHPQDTYILVKKRQKETN